jgi:DNA-binding MarR family transcriptional regulator
MNAAPAEVSTDTASRLRLAVSRLYRGFRRDRDDTELTAEQLTLLASISRIAPVRLGDLAQQEGVKPSSLTRSINWLADRGFIDRTVPADDRRATVVAISPGGWEVLESAWSQRSVLLATRIERLDPADRAVLLDALAPLEALVEEPVAGRLDSDPD